MSNILNILDLLDTKVRVPLEIKNNILEFTGYHRLRNGKYIKQIPKNGRLYKKMRRLINRMPEKINGYVILRMSDRISEVIMGPSFYYSNTSKRL